MGLRSRSRKIVRFIGRKKSERADRKLRSRILKFYDNRPKTIGAIPCLKEAIEDVRINGISVFPYAFRHQYLQRDTAVHIDESSGLPYVLHDGKRLYFPRKWDTGRVRHSYNFLCVEQDPDSPHRYLTSSFDVDEQTILLDVGSAEGMLSLDVVEKVKQVILFETEEPWLEPLLKTFEPWIEKVRVVNKFVSDKESESTVTLDGFLAREGIEGGRLMLKLDVEGAEKKVLTGAHNILTSEKFDLKAAVCTYHRKDDYDELSEIMNRMGFRVTPSKNQMLFIYDPEPLTEPFFRRGLIYCTKPAASGK